MVKFMLYIVPLQDELDLTLLPADAPEFMPKAACRSCKTEMPLQLLAFHIKDCGQSSFESQVNYFPFVEIHLSSLIWT